MLNILMYGSFNSLDAKLYRELKSLSEYGSIIIALCNDVENTRLHGDDAVVLLDRIECVKACRYIKDVYVSSSVDNAVVLSSADVYCVYDGDDKSLRDLRADINEYHKPEAYEVRLVPDDEPVVQQTGYRGFVMNDVEALDDNSFTEETQTTKPDNKPMFSWGGF